MKKNPLEGKPGEINLSLFANHQCVVQPNERWFRGGGLSATFHRPATGLKTTTSTNLVD